MSQRPHCKESPVVKENSAPKWFAAQLSPIILICPDILPKMQSVVRLAVRLAWQTGAGRLSHRLRIGCEQGIDIQIGVCRYVELGSNIRKLPSSKFT
jgi:hypothetical protein